ncbi:MAG: hypothetical protein OK438_08390 [Thaumarchaeota archaeon]|nr:hypothetical protein [Nitrososphaerota archaeon]
MERKSPAWVRAVHIVLGILSIGLTLVVVLNPDFGAGTIVLLMGFAVLLNSLRIASAGGVPHLPRLLRGLSLGLGLLTAGIVVFVILSPGIGLSTLALLLAAGLAIQGLDRVAHMVHRGHPRWLRVSALTVGVVTIVLAGTIAAFPNITLFTLVAFLTLTLLVNGIESIVVGIAPSSAKQLTLVKLVLFALFYGFVNVNWIDLYYNQVPAYHIWLILTYMAPFGVLLVFQGFKNWQLAFSLGLLVSLVNDLGYYFSGDLFFGFHVQLLPWLSGQLGFEGSTVLFVFQGGLFIIPVTSYLMAASIYGRIAVVAGVLYHWWRRPTSLPK